jgi:agmatinase
MTMLAAICQRASSHALRSYRAFSSTKSSSIVPGDQSELRGDGAIRRKHPLGSTIEQTYAGALSFLRRNYTRDLSNVDVAVTGIPLDLATTYRPGTRFGPKGIREASAQVAKRKSYPDGIDVFADLAVVDYGDCWFDLGQPQTIPAAIETHAREIIDQNVFLLSLGKSLVDEKLNTKNSINLRW